MYETLDDAIAAFAVAMNEMETDLGVEGDEIAYDVCVSVALQCSPEIAKELCRVELGWVPESLGI